MTRERVPYGLWPSPITPEDLSQSKRLQDLAWDTDGHILVWLEGRSDRGVLVCLGLGGDAARDLTTDLNVRARVGYGGGDMTVAQGYVYFAANERLYRQPLAAGAARAISPAFGAAASPQVSPDGRWVLYVHSYEDTDCLALVDAAGEHWPQRLISGADFYMQPVWHPDGRRIAWVAWDHPQMPWDSSRLEMAALHLEGPGLPTASDKVVLVGDESTSIFQPTFSPDGRYLAYVSDAGGWYNLYLYDLARGTGSIFIAEEAEWGVPAWAQGMRTYDWSPDGKSIYYCRNQGGFVKLYRAQVASREAQEVAALVEYSDVSHVAVSATGQVAVIASNAWMPARIVIYDPATGWVRIAARAHTEAVPAEVLSAPQAISWPSTEGDIAHGLLYMPREERFASSGKPPLVVMVHGGPTSQRTAGYSANDQFLTTRGYAVLEVNHRGSSGYGRAYRNKLREQWGIYDVDDAVTGARHLAEQGLVDGDKLVIMGGSAGGYTVLQALVRFPGAFKAGVCLYGVTNLFTLAADTHKFERRYLDSIIGPLPETAERYRERSPVFHADRIRDPVAIFQGEEDRVVPLEQAETIVQALRLNNVPHEYHRYAGEGHGWRKAETVREFLHALDRFLRNYVLFG